MLALSLVVALPLPASAAGCDLDEVVGYQLVARKNVAGWLDDAGKEHSGYFGCAVGRVLVFSDHTGVRCLGSTVQQAVMPPAYLFARSRGDLKLCIGDDLFKVAPVK